jgi:dCTP deaminase
VILSDHTLKQYLDSGKIVLEPLTEKSIQGASIDCRLGDHFLMVDEQKMTNIDFDTPIQYREVIADSIIIPPHSFILATTIEYLEIPDDLTAFIEGRSSIGRIGLFIQNAGWVDPGFKGKLTLELYNANSLPIKLEAGRRICQFVFCSMDHPADAPYGKHPFSGKYQGQDKATGSRVFNDVEVKV